MTKGIKCVAPVFDLNGYGQWSRGYILSLIKAGVPVTIFPVSFDRDKPTIDFGPDGGILEKHVNAEIDYDTCIAWLVPDIAKKIFDMEPEGVKTVSMSLWETLNLPKSWLRSFESIDEIWVCGEWGRRVYQDSIDAASLKKTVKVVPYPVRSEPFQHKGKIDFSSIVPNQDFTDYFKFYYISQWNARKNFQDLLFAYWQEFTNEDKVLLVLKTYINDQSREDRDSVNRILANLSSMTGKKDLAPVILLHGAFSSEKMVEIHNSCDCFVSPSRGEGLGLGLVEATLAGNPVICSHFGEQTSYILSPTLYNSGLTPVIGMQNYTWYDFSQSWASPDVGDMSLAMRECFLDPTVFNRQARESLINLKYNFTFENTSSKILELLNE
jgi:glycosyltransferase involved in cell wall biosynthesis